MISTAFKQHLEDVLGEEITELQPVSGGDINHAERLRLRDGSEFFLKYQDHPTSPANLTAEADGLRRLKETTTVQVPEVVSIGKTGDTGYLVLPWKTTARPTRNDWITLGEDLAALHRASADTYGLEQDNFIGSLPQSNTRHYSWAEFYRDERLIPQIALAGELLDATLRLQLDQLCSKLQDIAPCAAPALIHGDLWGGNKMFTSDGPMLIDPAVCFANREMDLAMTLLFGGFEPAFYEAYQGSYPLEPGWEDRIELYQLYYILVHVNLFGRSYLGSTQRIVNKYVG